MPIRVAAATTHGLRVVNLCVPNGQSVASATYAYKLKGLAALDAWLRTEARDREHLPVLGDFNIAPEDRDVHDPAKWTRSVLVSEPERAARRALLSIALVDGLRLRAAAWGLQLVGLPRLLVPPQQRPCVST